MAGMTLSFTLHGLGEKSEVSKLSLAFASVVSARIRIWPWASVMPLGHRSNRFAPRSTVTESKVIGVEALFSNLSAPPSYVQGAQPSNVTLGEPTHGNGNAPSPPRRPSA